MATTSNAIALQRKRRPMSSGWSVRTNTLTRHSGRPAATSRAHISASTPSGVAAEHAPSTSHSIVLCTSVIAALSPARRGEGTPVARGREISGVC